MIRGYNKLLIPLAVGTAFVLYVSLVSKLQAFKRSVAESGLKS